MTDTSNRLLVLAGGTVLAGPALAPVRADVVVAGGLITEVAEAGQPARGGTMEGAETLDCTGLTVVPGFIDAHVHIGLSDPLDVLRGGVTTVRDLAWPPDEIFPLAEASRAPDFAGCEVLAAGQMLTAPGGYPTRAAWAPPGTGREVRSPDDAAAAVAEQVAQGARVIKVALNPPVGPVLDAPTLSAIVDAAHSAGRRVTAHIHGLVELHKALDRGVDECAHMLMGTERIPRNTLEAMAAASMVVVPTLACRSGEVEVAVANLAAFLDAGGTVVYGTDLGNQGVEPGIDRGEVEAMSRGGMSPRDIVAAATCTSATWLGLEDRGVIEPGRRADLVALDSDPRHHLVAREQVRFVVREGRLWSPMEAPAGP